MPEYYFPKKAMVLAAGLGIRMRPYTATMPKPLVPVAGKPLIDWSLDLLHNSGVKDVVVNSFYMADMLEAHLRQRQQPHIHISREEIQLETGGGITRALPLLGDKPFFSINSDVICLNGAIPLLHRLAQRWDDATMDALLLVTPTATASGYDGRGDFHAGPTGKLRRRREWETAPFVFSGIQMVHPRLFANAPEGAFSMNVLWNRSIDAEKNLHRVWGLPHDGMWLHVGDPQGKREAERKLETVDA